MAIEHVSLVGTDGLGTWLGGRPTRTLRFDIVNTGDVRVSGATVSIVAGPKANPTGFVPPVKLDPLKVGERRSITLPIRFEALAFGDLSVRGVVRGASVALTFVVITSSHPWLLIIVPIVVLAQLVLLATAQPAASAPPRRRGRVARSRPLPARPMMP